MDRVIADFLDVLERGDHASLRLKLHPYVRWTLPSRETVRGRNAVLALLSGDPRVAEPESYELRDGQIYRWTARATELGR